MKFIFYLFAISFCLSSCSNNENNNQPKSTNLRLDRHIDSVSYAIGLDLATRLKQEFKDVDLEMLTNGINDYFEGNDLYLTDKERLAVIKKYNDITVPKYRLDLQYKVIKETNGPKPQTSDWVNIHYIGKLIDGTKFDSSYDRGEPANFPVSRVVPGLSQGLLLMSPGATYQFFIPGHLGYGQEDGPGGPMAVMIFQVEMLNILPPPEDENK